MAKYYVWVDESSEDVNLVNVVSQKDITLRKFVIETDEPSKIEELVRQKIKEEKEI